MGAALAESHAGSGDEEELGAVHAVHDVGRAADRAGPPRPLAPTQHEGQTRPMNFGNSPHARSRMRDTQVLIAANYADARTATSV